MLWINSHSKVTTKTTKKVKRKICFYHCKDSDQEVKANNELIMK